MDARCVVKHRAGPGAVGVAVGGHPASKRAPLRPAPEDHCARDGAAAVDGSVNGPGQSDAAVGLHVYAEPTAGDVGHGAEANRAAAAGPLLRSQEMKYVTSETTCTVRWSNFDLRDPKMGVFLQSTEATPCEHLLKLKFTPKKPPAHTMFMAAMARVLPWKIVEDFQSFVKNTKLWASLKKSVSCTKMGLNSSRWSCLIAWFKSYTSILFYNIFGQTIYWSTSKPWTNPQKTFKWPWKIKVSSTSSKFPLFASMKTCDLQILGYA